MDSLDNILEVYKPKMARYDKIDFSYACIFRNEADATSFAESMHNLNLETEILRNKKYVRIIFEAMDHNTRRTMAKHLFKEEYSMWNKTAEIQLRNDHNKYFMLGFYAKHAYLGTKVTVRSEHTFVGDYFQLKTDDPYDRRGYHIDVCPNTWAHSMFMKFKKVHAPEEITYPRDARVIEFDNHAPNDFFIYHTNWCWQLLSMGFNIGTDHDMDEIRSHVPEKHRQAFEAGCNFLEGRK